MILDNKEAKKVWDHFNAIFQVNCSDLGDIQARVRTWNHSSDFVKKGHVRVFIPIIIG